MLIQIQSGLDETGHAESVTYICTTNFISEPISLFYGLENPGQI